MGYFDHHSVKWAVIPMVTVLSIIVAMFLFLPPVVASVILIISGVVSLASGLMIRKANQTEKEGWDNPTEEYREWLKEHIERK